MGVFLLMQKETVSPADHLEEFRKRFPAFQLEDELFVQAGRSVMTGMLGA